MAMWATAFAFANPQANEDQAPQAINIHRDNVHNVLCVLDAEATLQAVLTLLMSPGSPLHTRIWSALKDLNPP
jgi:hypothetical protein